MKNILLFLLCLISLNSAEFSDQNGNKLKFDGPVKSVALFPVPLASFSISVENNVSSLASIHPIAQKNIKRGMLGKMIPGSKDILAGGINDDFMPNIEELIKLSPELVVQWGMRGEKLIEPLRKAGLNVALVNFKGAEEDALFWFEMLGKIYEKESRVEQILKNRTELKDRVEKFSINLSKKPKVLFIFGRDKSYEAAGANTYFDYEIALAGGRNASNFNGFKIINKEDIIVQNPDVILLSNFDELTPSDFFNDKILKSVRAVKEKAVYKMPLGGDMWEPPTGESHLSWTWLSIIFSGQAHINLKDEMRNSYELLYNYRLNDEDIAQILRFEQNGASKFYELFK